MKKILNLLGILFVLILLNACSEDSKTIPSLEIGKADFVFSNVASSEEIIVTTNQENFKVSVSEKWIKAEKKEKSIRISVEENLVPEERKGFVTIEAGILKEQINVTQKGADLNVVLLPQNFDVESKGGNFSFNLSTNATNYAIEASVDWIVLNSKMADKDNLVMFEVKENTTGEERQGKIHLIIANKIVEEISVIQKGMEAFVLPYLIFGKTAVDVKEFENNRKSKILRESDISGTGTQVAFEINDRVFNEFVYLINLKGYVQSSMFAKGGVLKMEDKEAFEKFLVDSGGFNKITDKGYETTISFSKVDKTVFVNTEKQVKIEFMADPKHEHYRIIYYPQQTKNYATFSAFPFFKKGIKKEEVEEYERNNKGTLNLDKSEIGYGSVGAKKDKLFFDIEGSDIMGRTYWVYYEGQKKHGLTQITNYYADVNLAFYQGLDGDYYLTKEFIALAEANGFIYQGVTKKGSSWFKNEAQNIKMYVRWYKDEFLDWTLSVTMY